MEGPGSPAIASGKIRTFSTLDGLRGIAAMSIAMRHAPLLWPSEHPTGILYESYLAVDFFFVLSGFVLAYAYGRRLEQGMSVGSFMSARAIRLYPLYFLAIVILLPLWALRTFSGKIDPMSFGAHTLFAIFFVPAFFGSVLFLMNSPTWSLLCELVANAIFGLLGKRLTTRLLAGIVLSSAAVLVSSITFGWLGFGTGNGPMDVGPKWDSIAGGFARVAFSFFAGVLVYRLWSRHTVRVSLSPLVLAGALGLILLSYPAPSYRAAYDLTATLLVFPALVFLGAASIPGRHVTRLFAWLGGISYGVYVLQAPMYDYLGTAMRIVMKGSGANHSNVLGVAGIAVVVVFATIAEKYFDQPARLALARWWAAKPRRHAAAIGGGVPWRASMARLVSPGVFPK